MNWYYVHFRDLLPDSAWENYFNRKWKEARLRNFIFQEADDGKPVHTTGAVTDIADKGDVAAIRLDIRRKQENYVRILGENMSKMATKFAALQNQYNHEMAEMREFKRKADGMLSFCYAIAKRTSTEIFHDEPQGRYQRGAPASYAPYSNSPSLAGGPAAPNQPHTVNLSDEFPAIPDF